MSAETLQALAAIREEGLFEQLATAILREADPTYGTLVHPGVNVAGQTVKSPLDGVCFVKGASPPHMIAVHHTITARKDLATKWLHDPTRVKPRKRSNPAAPPGDLLKTADLVKSERIRTPNLRATLVLTTNHEPDEALVRDVQAAGRERGLEVDLWTRSRLSHFLDNQPTGQWIRWTFLGIEQEQLSPELLAKLSRDSLEIHRPPGDQRAWVPRSLDAALKARLRRDVTFVVAGSGLGKSVACYRHVAAHVEGGGFGIILPHQAVASAVTLDQALTIALRQLHPPLAAASRPVLSFCSPERPILLVVEDINRSGQAQLLAERLARWSRSLERGDEGASSPWRVVCPLWPEILSSLGEEARKCIEPLMIAAGAFTESEGRDAVLARAQSDGRGVSLLTAGEISHALGHDPLLIGLHDQSTVPEPHSVIGQFVDRSLSRAAADSKDLPAAEYRQALRALAGEMLANRQIELNWREISGWPGVQGKPLRLLGRLAHRGELIRLRGPSDDQRLLFRHDRVRDWILADAAAELDRRGVLAERIVADPYFAEIVGAVLAWGRPGPGFLQRVASSNPLALFCALRLSSPQAGEPHREDILRAINNWLDNPATHDGCNRHLRWEALVVLAETDSPEVPALVRKFRDRAPAGELARLRNGDFYGGIELCMHIEPGAGAPWRDIQIGHAKLRHGRNLSSALDSFLRRADLDEPVRIGALRMAGHLADPTLASAIETCWTVDGDRGNHLADYLWAFGECCGDSPAHYLGPVCDAWAALSDEPVNQGSPSPRGLVSAYELRWAFRRWPPITAIDYFVERGSNDDLRWPIIHMLDGVDHPKAVLFVVQELAALQRRLDGTKSFSPFPMMVRDGWRRAQEQGRPMSKVSRDALLELWRGGTGDKHLRVQAFSLWAAAQEPDDIEVLRAAPQSEGLSDMILRERLIRGDERANPALVEKLATDDRGYWWQCGRDFWAPELTGALDTSLGRRGARAGRTWGESFGSDWIIHEMITRLPERQAETLLLKHWSHLRFGPRFVQAALYISTPQLVEAAKDAIAECPEPSKLLEFLSQHFGIRTKGRPGLIREAQVHTLVPYLHLLSSMDISDLWKASNDRGWFATRRKHLDGRLQPPFLDHLWDRDRAVSQLNRMIAEKRHIWIDHWIDDFLKTDVPWAEILETMAAWLRQHGSIEALQLVADAVGHRGTREDLGNLRIYEGMPELPARQLVQDTHFRVYRRSIR